MVRVVALTTALLTSAFAPAIGQSSTLEEIASTNNELAILSEALRVANFAPGGPLNDTEAEFTVFAPVNAAFEVLGDIVQQYLEPKWVAHLSDVLLYHVTDFAINSTEIPDGETVITMLNGENVTVTKEGAGVVISSISGEGSTVVLPDVEASNGYAHVVDTVLLPSHISTTLQEVAATLADYSTVFSLAEPLLSQAPPESIFTLLAPSNAAFEDLGEELISQLTCPENSQELLRVLSGHVIPDVAPSAILEDGTVYETLDLAPLPVTIDGEGIFFGNAQVVVADILASNGIIHGLSAVIVPDGGLNLVECAGNVTDPPTVPDDGTIPSTSSESTTIAPTGNATPPFDPDIEELPTLEELVQATPELSTLLAAVVAAELGPNGPLNDTSLDLLAFAPVNATFEALGEEVLNQYLDPKWKAHLVDILLFHIANESFLLSNQEFGTFTLTMLNGETVTVSKVEVPTEPGVEGEVQVNISVSYPGVDGTAASVSVIPSLSDIVASNGVANVVDGVLLPSSVFNSLADIAPSLGNYSILYELIISVLGSGGLDELPVGIYTIFAPTNEAVSATFEPGTIEQLLCAENQQNLFVFLTSHVVADVWSAESLVGVESLNDFFNRPLEVLVDDQGNVSVGGATVVDPDNLANNGVLHGIDGVIIPEGFELLPCATSSDDPTPSATTNSPLPTVRPSDIATQDPDGTDMTPSPTQATGSVASDTPSTPGGDGSTSTPQTGSPSVSRTSSPTLESTENIGTSGVATRGSALCAGVIATIVAFVFM